MSYAPVPLESLKSPVLKPETPLAFTLHPLQANLPNTFSYGNCTAFVASVLPIPWSGNANRWDDNASAMGYVVSDIPLVGAVGQTDAYGLGHVVLVLQIEGNKVLVKEENYEGFGIISQRWADVSDFRYIYF